MKDKNFKKITLAICYLVLTIGVLYVSGTAIADSGTPSAPASLLSFLVLPTILVLIPLSLIRSINKSKGFPEVWHIVIFFTISILLGLYGNILTTYNYFVSESEEVTNAYQNINVAYEQRFNLVPNVASSTQSLTEFELEVIREITEARTNYLNASTVDQRVSAVNDFERSISNFVVQVENYPNLKSDSAFLRLIDTLESTEAELTTQKLSYNEAAAEYNKQAKAFPYNFQLNLMGLDSEKEYLYTELSDDIKNSENLLDNLN